MSPVSTQKHADTLILAARILLMALFLIFGWQKLTHFGFTIGYMAHTGAPMPTLAALISTVMELGVGLALLSGAFTRPLAPLMCLYTLGTGLIGHHYWTMSGMERFENEINFYKNLSIMGGLLLLSLTGAGRYSIDRLLHRA
ncbi:DoxX family protein [Acidocella sp.]|uniref:DoxX family protein n=1 Tax=Acidocella sp. TaxID=50710 RepID=UPI003D03EF96